MFIGYPRSGHSLVGSLLDAHPDAVIAHELGALPYVQRGASRNQLYWLILDADRRFTKSGRVWTEFTYAVPGQWQGRFRRLRVIGDKKGGNTTLALGEDPSLLQAVADVVGDKMVLIHVVRNPFDNIATMHRRGFGTLDECADSYFSRCVINDSVRHTDGVTVLDVRHEDVVENPSAQLGRLCSSLGLSTTTDYLADCASTVHAAPHRSRTEVTWPSETSDRVSQGILDFDFLDGYSFDG